MGIQDYQLKRLIALDLLSPHMIERHLETSIQKEAEFKKRVQLYGANSCLRDNVKERAGERERRKARG